MYGKKVKLRILFLSFIFLTIILTIFLVLKSLEENVVYFVSPTEIKNLAELDKKKVRVGGMVKEGSIQTSSNQISFIITDFKHEINVSFSGAVPNLFAEGKGVVAEGFLRDRNFLNAKKILAKHDENYMPPEVKEALEIK
ncbi:MAG: cytochrome c maturation protein CcmE [Candidatus Pelagibacter sp.]|jgi:cytochrome c-type biogenesis protein CcmE|nr:MAG: cytochrome c maturation protein CcmE [Candidatus Pelagibacter sp.]|tara:strand:+ start:103 stop:522 length:420 start_codon:yes stop_codon:yes gene_type:complete